MGNSKKPAVLIGLGKIATFYKDGLKDNGHYELRYVCDVNPNAEAVKSYSKEEGFDVEYFEDYREVFRQGETHPQKAVSVAIIATPPHTHAHIISDCARYGVLPIVEKPVADCEYDFNKLLKSGIHFKAMLHWKYGSEVRYFIDHLLPKIKKIDSVSISIDDPYLDEDGHIAREYLNKSGCWMDSGINALSLLSALLGNMNKCRIRSFKAEEDKKYHQPYQAECQLSHGMTKCTISIRWGRNLDMKSTTIISGDNVYELNHTLQTVSHQGTPVYCGKGSLPRLQQHYANLFAVPPGSLESKQEVAVIHRLLYMPINKFGDNLRGVLTNACRRFADFLFASDEKKAKLLLIIYALLILILCGLLYFLHSIAGPISEIAKEITKTVCAFLFSAIAYNGAKMLYKYIEDRQKVSHDNEQIEKMYGTSYRCDFLLNGSSCTLYYDDCWHPKPGEHYEFKVNYDSRKMFKPDDFISGNELEILKAHGGSRFGNSETLRLDDYRVDSAEGRILLELSISRSTYLYHMITNRAVDYKIQGQLSLRQRYEYRNRLTSLKESAFSNHLGIIGLVMLEDDYVLFPHRDTSSTISKNMITSGIAMPLLYNGNVGFADDVPFASYILEKLSDAMKVGNDFIEKSEVAIEMIGLGRDVYEGGKPSCFYLIRVNMTLEQYYQATNSYIEDDGYGVKIDRSKKVYVADYNSIRWQKHGELLHFNHHAQDGSVTAMCLPAEKNLLCNLYHYINFKR